MRDGIQINVKYVFHNNYQAHELFTDILYIIPGGWDRERIDLTDNLQLSSNHNRSFTMLILWCQNIYDMLYFTFIITFVVYNTKLKCCEVGLSYFTDPRIKALFKHVHSKISSGISISTVSHFSYSPLIKWKLLWNEICYFYLRLPA